MLVMQSNAKGSYDRGTFFLMEYEENKEIKICLNYPCTEF